jgi:hypothetical protein
MIQYPKPQRKDGGMRVKVEKISRGIAEGLARVGEIECVTLGEAANEDFLDPYFTLVMDAYCSGPVPDEKERRAMYGNPMTFETALHVTKDRFFSEDCPVHVEFHATEAVDGLISGKKALASAVRETGTHPFYKLHECKLLFSRTGWIDKARAATRDLSDSFWEGLLAAFSAKMEHFLSDLGGSLVRSDDFFSSVSLSGFLSSTSSTLFALNKRFEPPYRYTTRDLRGLAVLPDGFMGRWENLVRQESGHGLARKYEIAKLVALSVFAVLG